MIIIIVIIPPIFAFVNTFLEIFEKFFQKTKKTPQTIIYTACGVRFYEAKVPYSVSLSKKPASPTGFFAVIFFSPRRTSTKALIELSA